MRLFLGQVSCFCGLVSHNSLHYVMLPQARTSTWRVWLGETHIVRTNPTKADTLGAEAAVLSVSLPFLSFGGASYSVNSSSSSHGQISRANLWPQPATRQQEHRVLTQHDDTWLHTPPRDRTLRCFFYLATEIRREPNCRQTSRCSTVPTRFSRTKKPAASRSEVLPTFPRMNTIRSTRNLESALPYSERMDSLRIQLIY
jgi:hypothetical protein